MNCFVESVRNHAECLRNCIGKQDAIGHIWEYTWQFACVGGGAAGSAGASCAGWAGALKGVVGGGLIGGVFGAGLGICTPSDLYDCEQTCNTKLGTAVLRCSWESSDCYRAIRRDF
jgi:hypothetical protein